MNTQRVIVCTAFVPFFLAGMICNGGPLVRSIAHRGGGYIAPENTCAAFAASARKCDMVEFDVYASSDGKLVVIHDNTVDRTTDGTGFVHTKTLAQLKMLDAGYKFSPVFKGERIPTFAEAIQTILPSAVPVIDRKGGSAQLYVDAIHELNITTNVVLIAFDWNFLRDVHALDSNITLAALGGGTLTTSVMTNLLARGITKLFWSKDNITQADIQFAHSFGMEFVIWTVNDRTGMQVYIDMNVDGVVSDNSAMVSLFTRVARSANHELADGLISYWKFDDGLNSDASAMAADVEMTNPGYLSGFESSPGWMVGDEAMSGGSLFLDGINNYVGIPASDSLNINTNAVSISLWVKLPRKPSSIPDNFGAIYDSISDSYVMYLDRGNRELRFKVTDQKGDSMRVGIPEADIVTGQWHHVVGIYDGSAGPVAGAVAIFLDGRLKNYYNGSVGSEYFGLKGNVLPGQSAAIGRNGTENRYGFSGCIDDVAIWRRALTYGEILQIYAAGTQKVALQKNIMSMEIRNMTLSEDGSVLEIETHVDHAILSASDIRLRYSNHSIGIYANDGGVNVQSRGNGNYLFSEPVKPSEVMLFHVENP